MTKNDALRLVLCVGILIAAVSAVPSQNFLRLRRARWCGPMLAEVLAMVCDSVYYMPRSIRSPRLPFKNEAYWHEVASLNSEQMRTPNDVEIFGKQEPMTFIPRNKEIFQRQTRQGIVDECCKKSCSIDELRAYCGPETE